MLPGDAASGDLMDCSRIRPEQHFTEPPPRYREASPGQGHWRNTASAGPPPMPPSSPPCRQREYVDLDKKRFTPTDVGRVVNKFLTEYFTAVRGLRFHRAAGRRTGCRLARRGGVGAVARSTSGNRSRNWSTTPKENVKRSDVTQESPDELCPKCGRPLSIRLGRRGRFIGCSDYPECDYTRNLDDDKAEAEAPEIVEGRSCPRVRLAADRSSAGATASSSVAATIPSASYIEPLEKPADTGVTCPKCQKGTLLKRKSRRGKIFYSCSTYPKCDYAVWNEPVQGALPQCNWPILTLKTTKRRGTEKVCPQPDCKFSEAVEAEDRSEIA